MLAELSTLELGNGRVAEKFLQTGSGFRSDETTLSRVSVDENMGIAADDTGNVGSLLEDSNFIGDRTRAESRDSKTQIKHCGEGKGREEVRVGGDDETNERRGGWGEMCVLDEVGVDDGIEEVVVDGVVDMGVLIVVSPANVQ